MATPQASPQDLLRTAQTANVANALRNPKAVAQTVQTTQQPYAGGIGNAGQGGPGQLGDVDLPPIGSGPGDYPPQPVDPYGFPYNPPPGPTVELNPGYDPYQGYGGDPNPYYGGPHNDNLGLDPSGTSGEYYGDYRDNASNNDYVPGSGDNEPFYPQVTETDSTPEPWYGRLARLAPLPYGMNAIPQVAHTIMEARRQWLATHPHDQAGTHNGVADTNDPNAAPELNPRQQWEMDWAGQLADARRMSADSRQVENIAKSVPVGSRLAGGHTGDAGHDSRMLTPAQMPNRAAALRALYPHGISTGTDPNTGQPVHATPIGRDAVSSTPFTPPSFASNPDILANWRRLFGGG